MEAVVRDLWAEIDRRGEWLVEICRELITFPTENPPGDTTECAEFIASQLAARDLSFETFEPQPTMRSLISSMTQGEGPHLMFNCHMDVFPAGDASMWAVPPFSGVVQDGKLYGRGAADMKGGLTASLAAFLLIRELAIPLRGRLTFMAVADEETGGMWGTKWLLEQRPDFVPDACLIGEPCAPDAVRVGEKGIAWIVLTSRGHAYHASLAAGENCITRLADAIGVTRGIVGESGNTVPDLVSVIEGTRRHYLNEDFRGREWLLDHASCNIGTIRGGIKVNVVPHEASAEVDIRIPFGWAPRQAFDWVRSHLDAAGLNDVEVALVQSSSPNFTSPNHQFAQTVHRYAAMVMGSPPLFTITTAATDGRFFRIRNVPTVIYGPRPNGVGGTDEYITVEDLVRVTKVHAAVALAMTAQ